MFSSAALRPILSVRERTSPRTALVAVFGLNGFVFGSWASRIPDVAVDVGATHATLGAALLCLSVGALATMQTAGRLCARLGAGKVTAAAAALVSLVVVVPAAAGSAFMLGVGLAILGAVSGLLNVSMNSAGVHLEGERTRPLLPLLHAASSFGGLAGALVGGVAAQWLTPALHLGVVGALGLVVVTFAGPVLLHATDERTASVPSGRPGPVPREVRGVLVMLGVIAGCTAYGEGALNDWSALYLRTDLQAAPVVAASAYAGFSLAMGCGRLTADRLLDAIGETRLLAGGAVLAAVGMLTAAVASTAPLALVGCCLVGLGLANLFPLALARAGAEAGSAGVALASTIGYAGLLTGPPVIGLLAAWLNLRIALTSVSALALLAALLAVRVRADSTNAILRSAWYRAGQLARPGTPLSVVALGLRLGTEQHSRSLAPLHPVAASLVGDVRDSRETRLSPYPGLQHLLD